MGLFVAVYVLCKKKRCEENVRNMRRWKRVLVRTVATKA